MGKRILRILGMALAAVLFAVVGLIVFLSVTEYKPADRQMADRIVMDADATVVGQSVAVCSWNIGYAGLGKESDFFMDGGSMVDPPSQEVVKKNLAGIRNFMQETAADAWLLQEVDVNSARTGSMDQFSQIHDTLSGNAAFAYNYKCPFVPIPMPPMGKVESGLATFTGAQMEEDAERIALPCPFSWPVRAANLKRCLLVTRLPVEGTDRELVLVNLHLEAYESGEGRIAQTRMLMDLMQEEYEKGNYVIAGGDFNQSFPGTLDTYPIQDPESWMPGVLSDSDLPEGWRFACDGTATCRLLDRPYTEACQLYVIDGFILSPNVELEAVQTVSMEFSYSDHNPVLLHVSLLP